MTERREQYRPEPETTEELLERLRMTQMRCALGDPAHDLAELNELVHRLSDTLDATTRERDELQKRVADLNAKVDKYVGDQLDFDAMATQLKAALQECNVVGSERDELRRQCRGFRAALETHEELKAKQQAENERLRALLREAAPKCIECGTIAVWWSDLDYTDDGVPIRNHSCDEHHDWQNCHRPDDLGLRIRAALGEEETT